MKAKRSKATFLYEPTGVNPYYLTNEFLSGFKAGVNCECGYCTTLRRKLLRAAGELKAKFRERVYVSRDSHDALLAALKETTEAAKIAVLMAYELGQGDEYIMRCHKARIKDGFGARALAAIQEAEAPKP